MLYELKELNLHTDYFHFIVNVKKIIRLPYNVERFLKKVKEARSIYYKNINYREYISEFKYLYFKEFDSFDSLYEEYQKISIQILKSYKNYNRFKYILLKRNYHTIDFYENYFSRILYVETDYNFNLIIFL